MSIFDSAEIDSSREKVVGMTALRVQREDAVDEGSDFSKVLRKVVYRNESGDKRK